MSLLNYWSLLEVIRGKFISKSCVSLNSLSDQTQSLWFWLCRARSCRSLSGKFLKLFLLDSRSLVDRLKSGKVSLRLVKIRVSNDFQLLLHSSILSITVNWSLIHITRKSLNGLLDTSSNLIGNLLDNLFLRLLSEVLKDRYSLIFFLNFRVFSLFNHIRSVWIRHISFFLLCNKHLRK